ncbi:MAG: choice-of-anchor Q domain-containing protein [Parafilimonas sp.]
MNHKLPAILIFIFLTGNLLVLHSCKKDSFITSADAFLFTSTDSLHFDTVFTTIGSVTQSFKIFNPNNQKLRINRLELAGSASSFFNLNADGSPGTSFSNIDINANDSIYVFVSVTINPNSNTLPFLIQDSILIEYNSNQKYIQLNAYGQNANFLNYAIISRDTVWNNELPFVITGSLTINAGKILTINKGTHIYCNADAPILVNGTVKVNGEKYDSTKVIFIGDRLDEPYKNFPGSWPGIFFFETSINNELHFADIENATQGFILQAPSINSNPKLSLYECIINNIYDAAIFSVNSSVYAQNCLISNCGGSNIHLMGGRYNFLHCTVASYSHNFLNHTSPVLSITDQSIDNMIFSVNANFTNCILYGESGLFIDEISLAKYGSDFNADFKNIFYKGSESPLATYTNSIQNQDPQFLNIDIEHNIFDFHLQSASPCINAGAETGIITDLDENSRNFLLNAPDIGCYEFQ